MPRESVVERSVDIAAEPDEVFRFHLDTRNAARIAPAGARVLAVEGEFPAREGALVTMRMRQGPLPLAQTWRVRIAEVVPGRRIVDVAERSPFAAWRHEHRFDPLPGGGTRMTDRVVYRLPAGPLGRLADRLLVRRMLERAFAERHARTRAVLEGG